MHHVSKYRKSGFLDSFSNHDTCAHSYVTNDAIGVIDTSSFIYKLHDATSVLVLEHWWLHITQYTTEDQISLPYVLWDFETVTQNILIMPRLTNIYLVGCRNPYIPHDLNKPNY